MSSSAARCADRRDALRRADAPRRAGPTPGRRRTSNGARKAASFPGRTTVRPPGFRRSEATLATTFVVATPRRAAQGGRASDGSLHRLGDRAAPRGSPPPPRRGRGSPRRALCARLSGRPRGSRSRRLASSRGRACAAAERRPRADSAAMPRRSSSPSGSRTCARRSSPSRRRRARAGRRRRSSGLRRSDGSSSSSTAAKKASRSRCATITRTSVRIVAARLRRAVRSAGGVGGRSGCAARVRDGRVCRRPAARGAGGRHRARDGAPAARRTRARS